MFINGFFSICIVQPSDQHNPFHSIMYHCHQSGNRKNFIRGDGKTVRVNSITWLEFLNSGQKTPRQKNGRPPAFRTWNITRDLTSERGICWVCLTCSTEQGVPSGRFPLCLVCDHAINIKLRKMVKSWNKSGFKSWSKTLIWISILCAKNGKSWCIIEITSYIKFQNIAHKLAHKATYVPKFSDTWKKQGSDKTELRLTWREMENLIWWWFLEKFLRFFKISLEILGGIF